MTMRTTLLTTVIAASALLAAPAIAGDGNMNKNHKTKTQVEIDMTDPAAKAPMQQQKAEDLYERAQEQYDAGMTDAARTSAVRGVVMEIKAENNVANAEMQSGEEYVLETQGETSADIQGEDFTALVDTNARQTITVPTAAPSLNCPSGTQAQSNGTCLITGDFKM